ncbi:hypothetical protein B0H63DRAFT_244534 [Podospora didyma]|uniref:Uncharacterized protein n=1 Tax=Podospora didyma TaxID=330526 RepID=A0AAE0KKI2_9PEZI|nr:hypothetical protein B0H63DRAFT_244534 [Podospora didyma]
MLKLATFASSWLTVFRPFICCGAPLGMRRWITLTAGHVGARIVCLSTAVITSNGVQVAVQAKPPAKLNLTSKVSIAEICSLSPECAERILLLQSRRLLSIQPLPPRTMSLRYIISSGFYISSITQVAFLANLCTSQDEQEGCPLTHTPRYRLGGWAGSVPSLSDPAGRVTTSLQHKLTRSRGRSHS